MILQSVSTSTFRAIIVAAVCRASWKVNPSSPARSRYLRKFASSEAALMPNTSGESQPSMRRMVRSAECVSGTLRGFVFVTGSAA